MDIEKLIDIFENEIPFNRILGLKILELQNGEGLMMVPYREDLLGDVWRGALHGGVTASLADAAGGVTVWSKLSDFARLSTIDLRIDYLRPGKKEALFCRTEVVRLGKQVATVSMSLYHDGGPPIAEARGVYNISNRTVDR